MSGSINFSAFDQQCKDLLDALPKRHSRSCFRSAFHHLDMAQKIADLDPTMAAFRCLTAEEEAASGLMHCLKERAYTNSNLLKPRDHVHKNAIAPFLDVLGMFFSETFDAHINKPELFLFGDDAERKLILKLFIPSIDGGEWVYPIPPLNFSINIDSKSLSYRKQIDYLVNRRGANNISDYIKSQANIRNTLLYAAPEGYPDRVELPINYIEVRKVRIMALVRGYLMIQPYKEQLPFVQDALDAFLLMLGNLKQHELHEYF
jgi:hypothetical protein